MNSVIVGAGISDAARAEALKDDPDFRRATLNVRLAASAVEKAMAMLSEPWSAAGPRVALVVATGHGELEPTAVFLQELGRSNVARPLLFQNSLHNTVTGFLAQRLALRGPVMTVSNTVFSGEDALEVASTLLADDADLAVVVGVDSFPDILEALLPSVYPNGFRPMDRAAAVLLANERGRAQFSQGPALVLESIERQLVPEGLPELHPDFFDAGAVAMVAEAVLDPSRTARSLHRTMPRGTSSQIHVRWTP